MELDLKTKAYWILGGKIAIAAVCAVGAVLLLRRRSVGRAWYAVKYVGTVAITTSHR